MAVGVGVFVGVNVAVAVGVGAQGVNVAVAVDVGVGVLVAVEVAVEVAVAVDVGVGVAVAPGTQVVLGLSTKEAIMFDQLNDACVPAVLYVPVDVTARLTIANFLSLPAEFVLVDVCSTLEKLLVRLVSQLVFSLASVPALAIIATISSLA